MKIRLRHSLLVLIALMIGATPFARADKKEDAAAVEKLLKPDKGVGTRYGSRDPYVCASSKEPEKGAPTAAQARAYFIAQNEFEKVSGGLDKILYLTQDVTLEIGKGRPFMKGDGTNDDVDPAELVYPVRGGYTIVTCYPVNSVYPEGKSCTKGIDPHAIGLCYKTTFGDWKCLMVDVEHHSTLPGWFPAPK